MTEAGPHTGRTGQLRSAQAAARNAFIAWVATGITHRGAFFHTASVDRWMTLTIPSSDLKVSTRRLFSVGCEWTDHPMQSALIEIGDFDPAEADLLGIVFFDAVRDGAAGDYDVDQRRAWAAKAPSGPDWASRLAAERTVVAREAGRPVGFMTLGEDGYIDLAFVAPSHQGRGIGGRLYSRIEAIARETGVKRLHSQASYLARRLFEQRGWTVVREQQIERANVTLTNFVMEKVLAG